MDTFTFHADPSHGWLEVPWTALKALSLNPTDFSRYSYRHRNTFYLEEDCDASKFLMAYKAKHGDLPTLQENVVNGRSHIRNMDPIY